MKKRSEETQTARWL